MGSSQKRLVLDVEKKNKKRRILKIQILALTFDSHSYCIWGPVWHFLIIRDTIHEVVARSLI